MIKRNIFKDKKASRKWSHQHLESPDTDC